MLIKAVYFAAVVHPVDPEQIPFVSTPVGPYAPEDDVAHERARAFLREAYKTEDVRRVQFLGDTWDFDDARHEIMGTVAREHETARRKREYERAEEALSGLGPEVWEYVRAQDVDPDNLDRVLADLGVNPADV